MNSVEVAAANLEEIIDVVRGADRVLAVGNRTKPPLSHCPDATSVSLRNLSGITEYEPSEFTFTALAGTPIAEIVNTLAERGQCLPFDPLLIESGATLGGTVAAGLSGPGRFRFGGIRDFLLGIHFISGDGQQISGGGKVVKNAAGFDLPKFFVGSLGRFGILTQLTMKVFPRPVATQTMCVQCENHRQAMERTVESASSRWELDAIDYVPSEHSLRLRLTGPPSAIDSLAGEIDRKWGQNVSKLEQADAFWHPLRELADRGAMQTVVKVPSTLDQAVQLQESLETDSTVQLHTSAAGNVNWLWIEHEQALESMDEKLLSLNLAGLIVRGDTERYWIGRRDTFEFHHALQNAMDPPGKFPRFGKHAA